MSKSTTAAGPVSFDVVINRNPPRSANHMLYTSTITPRTSKYNNKSTYQLSFIYCLRLALYKSSNQYVALKWPNSTAITSYSYSRRPRY